jgi:5-methylcytosine-specific restriction endonuclease McrA
MKKHISYFHDHKILISQHGEVASSPINAILLNRYYFSLDKSICSGFRLLKFARKWKKKIFKNTQYVQCWICNRNLDKTNATMDHLVAISNGGKWDDINNIAPACKKCNSNRGNTPVEQIVKQRFTN